MKTLADIATAIQSWDNICVISHASPDGDTLGSATALIRGLRSLGKRVMFACCDPIPDKYLYLFDEMDDDAFEPEKAISVDVADRMMFGKLQETIAKRIDLAIDHHLTHAPFAEDVYLDASCAANAEIIYFLLVELGIEIEEKIATGIFTGLTTDTGCFRYRNVTPQTHHVAAQAMLSGAKAAEVNRMMFETKSRAQTEAEIAALSSLEFQFDGRCALLAITRELMERTGIAEEELDFLVAKPRQIEGVLIGVTMKEKAEGGFKISVRTNEPANASEICVHLGGGGHRGAAGCMIGGDLAPAKEKMLGVCKRYLEEKKLWTA